jgi:hypothetical protein
MAVSAFFAFACEYPGGLEKVLRRSQRLPDIIEHDGLGRPADKSRTPRDCPSFLLEAPGERIMTKRARDESPFGEAAWRALLVRVEEGERAQSVQRAAALQNARVLCVAIGNNAPAEDDKRIALYNEVETAVLTMKLDADICSPSVRKKRRDYSKALLKQTRGLLSMLNDEHAEWLAFSITGRLHNQGTSISKLKTDLSTLLHAVDDKTAALRFAQSRGAAEQTSASEHSPFENLIGRLAKIYYEYTGHKRTSGTSALSPFERFVQAVIDMEKITKSNGKSYKITSIRKALTKVEAGHGENSRI